MDLVQTQYRIRQLLSFFVNQVEAAGVVGTTDINHYAETILIPLFSEIYGYTQLKNLNSSESQNYPGIDLGDDVARVAFQITSTSNSEKVKKTLRKFVEYELYEKYDRLIIFILTRKQRSYSGAGFANIMQDRFMFDKDQDIRDYLDIVRVIDTFQLDRALRILDILERNFGTGVRSVPVTNGPNDTITISSVESLIRSMLPDMSLAVAQEVVRLNVQPDLSSARDDGGCRSQVDLARDFVQQGKPDTARAILLRLHDPGQQPGCPADQLFHVSHLLGCCALALDDIVAAQTYFAEALDLEPDNWKALTNNAMAALLAGDAGDALVFSSRAYQIEPHDSHVLLAYVQALHKNGRAEELAHLLQEEPSIADFPASAAALANMRIDAGDYQAAEVLAERAVDGDPDNPQFRLLLAYVLIVPLRGELIISSTSTDHTRNRLQAAENALSRAVTLAEQGSSTAVLHAALVSRAGVRSIAGDFIEGLRDCERVLMQDEHHIGALENKGRLLLGMGRALEAVPCFEAVLQGMAREQEMPSRFLRDHPFDHRIEVTHFLAGALLEAGQPGKVIATLSGLPQDETSGDLALGTIELLLLAYAELHDDPVVAELILRLETGWLFNPIAKLILAEHYSRTRELTRAGALFQEAMALAQGQLRATMTLRLAHLRFCEGNYAEAIEIYRTVVDQTRDNRFLREYILCLYNVQDFPKALRLAQHLRAIAGPIPDISAIEAIILEQGGELDGAREVWRQLTELNPTNIEDKVSLAQLEWRALNHDAAKELVLSIPYETVKNDTSVLLQLASLRLMLDLPSVLAFAYQARRLGYADSEIHLHYLSICFHLEGSEADEALHEPTTVDIGTSVHVAHNGATSVFTILDDTPIFYDRGELSSHEPRAINLLGRSKGERVIQDGLMGDLVYEITDIQTKYLSACHQTIHMFATGLLHHPGIEVSDVNDPGFMERLVMYLDRQEQQRPDFMAFYRERRVPLSTLSVLVHRALFDVWLTFVDSPDHAFRVAMGHFQEAEQQHATLATTSAVVLDTTALLTLVYVGIESMIPDRFDALYIAQATLDELRMYQFEQLRTPPTGHMGSFHGQRYFLELPEGYIERRRSFVAKVLSFIENHVHVMPTMDIIALDPHLLRNLGRATAAAVVLAKGQDLPLYADDLHLRQLAEASWQVQGFDTQALVRDLYARHIIDQSQYYETIILLATANYVFVRTDVDGLMWALEQNSLVQLGLNSVMV